MRDTLERLILLQIGAASATRDRIEQAVSELVEQGRLEREEGRGVVEDVAQRARERSGGARGFFDSSVHQGLRGAGFPNRQDYEDLVFRIEQLEHRLRVMEGRPGEAASTAAEPSEPPRDVPENPPGL